MLCNGLKNKNKNKCYLKRRFQNNVNFSLPLFARFTSLFTERMLALHSTVCLQYICTGNTWKTFK